MSLQDKAARQRHVDYVYATTGSKPKRSGTPTYRQLQQMTAERKKKFDEFPKGAQLQWYGEAVGTVTGHDVRRGRVICSNGCSYNPDELKVVPDNPA